MGGSEIHIPPDWQRAAEEIVTTPGVAVVLGGTDSGKSTFCTFLARTAAERGHRVALVDADIGQSRVGPPGCIGWAWVTAEGIGPEQDLWFVGAFSPARHLADCVVGTFRMTMAALSRGATLTVVDTTGLVRGREGFQLKMAKLHCLRPGHVVAFRRDLEGTALLEVVSTSGDWRTHVVDVPAQVRVRGREERREYRMNCLRAYLAEAQEEEFGPPIVLMCQNRRLALHDVPAHAAEPGSWHGGVEAQPGTWGRSGLELWEDLLCSVESEYGRSLGIGITLSVGIDPVRVRVLWKRHKSGEARLIRVSESRVMLLESL